MLDAPKAASAWLSKLTHRVERVWDERGHNQQVQRLKTRSQFQAVLAGTTVARTAHFAMHSTSANHSQDTRIIPGCLSLGALIPKRWARRAVTRNVIRRQIFSMALEFEDNLPQQAYVVRLRASFDRKLFKSAASQPLKHAVRSELERLYKKAQEQSGASVQ